MGQSNSLGGYDAIQTDNFWTKTKVKDVAHSQKAVISVTPDDTIEQSLEKLHTHHILSAPIIKDGKCLGFWGMDNLLIALLKTTNSPLTLKGRERSGIIKSDTAYELEYRHKTFQSKRIANCQYEINFHGISSNASLHDAMLAFAAGVQRIAVFDDAERKGPVKKIISQSCILAYIAEDPSRLGSLEKLPAASLGIPWNRVLKAPSKMSTIDVLQMMHDRGVWGLPIIDDDENFIAHLSLTDFKTIHHENDFHILVEPVIEYVKKVRASQNREVNHIIHAKTDALMKDIVQILVKEHVHQLYMFDENNKPKSLISLTNVCHKVFSHSTT